MLSAESDGVIYYSGRIRNPKSRSYVCRVCEEPVSHVNATTRTLHRVPVVEHFRHMPGQGGLHPEIDFSWQAGEMAHRLIEDFSQLPNLYGFDTDRVYSGPDLRDEEGEFATHFSIDKNGNEIAVLLQAGGFSAKELRRQLEILRRQDIAAMVIFSAEGENNPDGKFFQSHTSHRRPDNLKKIPGNEKSLYERIGFNLYYDHDTDEFFKAMFDPFFETDYYLDREVERKTYKLPRELGRGHIIPARKLRRDYALIADPIFLSDGEFDILKLIDRLKGDLVEEEETEDLEEKICVLLEDFPEDHFLTKQYDQTIEKYKSS